MIIMTGATVRASREGRKLNVRMPQEAREVCEKFAFHHLFAQNDVRPGALATFLPSASVGCKLQTKEDGKGHFEHLSPKIASELKEGVTYQAELHFYDEGLDLVIIREMGRI